MRTLTPMAEKGAFVCQPVTSASERRILREGFAGLICEAASSAAGNAAETANGGLVLTAGAKRSVELNSKFSWWPGTAENTNNDVQKLIVNCRSTVTPD